MVIQYRFWVFRLYHSYNFVFHIITSAFVSINSYFNKLLSKHLKEGGRLTGRGKREVMTLYDDSGLTSWQRGDTPTEMCESESAWENKWESHVKDADNMLLMFTLFNALKWKALNYVSSKRLHRAALLRSSLIKVIYCAEQSAGLEKNIVDPVWGVDLSKESGVREASSLCTPALLWFTDTNVNTKCSFVFWSVSVHKSSA